MFSFFSATPAKNAKSLSTILNITEEQAKLLLACSPDKIKSLLGVKMLDFENYNTIKEQLSALIDINDLAKQLNVGLSVIERAVVKLTNIEYIISNPPMFDGKVYEARIFDMLKSLNIFDISEARYTAKFILESVSKKGMTVLEIPNVELEEVKKSLEAKTIQYQQLQETHGNLVSEYNEVSSKLLEPTTPASIEIEEEVETVLTVKEITKMISKTEKELARLNKLKERTIIDNEKAKAKADKEAEKAKALKEKEKAKALADKEKAKALKAKSKSKEVVTSKGNRLTQDEKDNIVELYNNEKSMAEIAEIMNTTVGTVRNTLIKAGAFTPTTRS